MRLIRIAVCVLMLMAACCCAAFADVEADVRSGTIELAAGGTAAVEISLTNGDETDITEAILYDAEGNVCAEPGEIPAEGSAMASFRCTISDAQLNAGSAVFTLNYQSDGKACTQEITVSAVRVPEAPDIEFTRRISSNYVSQDGELYILYTIRNTGNVPLRKIELTDALGRYHESLNVLEVGEEHTFTASTPITESVTSEPTITFIAGAADVGYSKSLAAEVITPAECAVTAHITADKTEVSYGESVTLTCTISNTGNVDLHDVTVTDAAVGLMNNAPLTVKSGSDSVVIVRNCTIRSDTNFCVTVHGYAATGDEITATTTVLPVRVKKNTVDCDISLTAAASADSLSEAGSVTFTLTLTNNGQTDLTRVTLGEETLGVIRTFDVIPAGEPTSREQSYTVTGDTEYHFYASLTDEEGTVHTVNADPVTITISADGEKPEKQSEGGLAGLLGTSSLYIGSVSVWPVMLAAFILLLLVVAVIAIRIIRRGRKTREDNRAERKKRSDRFGRTNKFTPLRRNNPKE